MPDRNELPPTLGELIESDKRLLVMAENDAGGGRYPWYQQGFDLVQETPVHVQYARRDRVAAELPAQPGPARQPAVPDQLLDRDGSRATRTWPGKIDSLETLLERPGCARGSVA